MAAAAGKPSLDNYIDVAERIEKFNEKYPEGSLQTVKWEQEEVGGKLFIVYMAAAYRTPDDTRPGMGVAWEPFPGPTTFTKDSELMNAETAAWGRAIVACGLPASRKIASRQEVQARQGAEPEGKPTPQPEARPPEKTKAPASAKQRGLIYGRASEHKLSSSTLANVVLQATGSGAREWDSEEAAHEWLKRAMDRLPSDAVNDVIARIGGQPDTEQEQLTPAG